jgi:hypothetical protein
MASDDFPAILSDRVIAAIFQTVTSHIDRPINPTPQESTGAALVPVYRILNWTLSSERVRPSMLEPHVRESLVRALFRAALSPAPSERVSACRSLVHIGLRHPKLRPCLASRAASALLEVRENGEQTEKLVPVLRFVLDSCVLPLMGTCNVFVGVFCPLVTVRDFELLYCDFAQVIEAFLRADQRLVPVFATYLLAHWPTDGMLKRGMFFEMLRDVVVWHGDSLPGALIGACLGRIADLFDDAVSEMAEAAIVSIGKQNVQDMLGRVSRSVVERIYQAAKRTAESYYAQQVRELAATLLWVMESSGVERGGEVGVMGARSENWEVVRSAAFKNWPNPDSFEVIEAVVGSDYVSH